MLDGVSVSCRISYFIVSYLYVSFSGLVTSAGEDRAIFRYRLFVIIWFRGFLLPLGTWNRLRYFIVALSVPSIYLFSKRIRFIFTIWSFVN